MTCQNVESQSLADSVISMQWTIEQMRVEKPHESGEWWHIARNINTTGAHWQKNAAAEYRSEGSNLVELLFNCLWLSAVRYKRRVSKWLPKEMTMTTCAKFSTSQSINQSTYQAGAKTEKKQQFKSAVYFVKQELSYRKQIARQLRTQYVEGIYRSNYAWPWNLGQWSLKITGNGTIGIDRTRLSISRVIWR